MNDEACGRCGRQFSTDDPRRGEWEEFVRADGTTEWICPYCLTDLDIRQTVGAVTAIEIEITLRLDLGDDSPNLDALPAYAEALAATCAADVRDTAEEWAVTAAEATGATPEIQGGAEDGGVRGAVPDVSYRVSGGWSA